MENRIRFPEFWQVCGKGMNERSAGRLQRFAIIPWDNSFETRRIETDDACCVKKIN